MTVTRLAWAIRRRALRDGRVYLWRAGRDWVISRAPCITSSGALVAVYTESTPVAWILDDLREVIRCERLSSA